MEKRKQINRVSELTIFQVYPGIEFIYNNFEVLNYNFISHATQNIMEINHCHKGRVEYELKDGTYLYLGEGDFAINIMNNHASAMDFSVNYYEGISVNLYLDVLKDIVPENFEGTSLDLWKMKDKFSSKNGCFIMRATGQIEHIFSELYKNSDEIREVYLKGKVIELLLNLNIVDRMGEKKESYYKCHVATVKRIRTYLIENYTTRYTIDELAKEYCISPTTLKIYFKEVFGTTIASYMKFFRMKKGAELLRDTHDSISDIANSVGYESQSKFAIVFKEQYNMSPLAYRKKYMFHGVKEDKGKYRCLYML